MRFRFLCAAAAVSAALAVLLEPSCASSQPSTRALDRITQRGRQFVDGYGRVRLFHGANDVRKSEPFYSTFSDADLALLSTEWGYNIVRLGFSWEGYERARGARDPAYLAATSAAIDRLASAGIYTIIDNHQDLMSRSHCGNGFPPWVVRIDDDTQENAPFPVPVLQGPVYEPDPATGWIRGEDCARTYWANYYFTAVTGAMFEAFYADVDGIQTALVEMWRDVAAAFAGRPEVFSYEVMNEPFPGSIYRDPLLLFNATYADASLLVPLYERVHAAIRSVDNDTFFFYEPTVSNTMILPRTSGLVTPGGPDFASRAVLSFHAYCIQLDSSRNFCDEFLRGTMQQRERDADRMGVAKMLTEFGHLRGTTDEIVSNNTRTLDLADENLLSWTTWEFATLANDQAIAKSLVRPYARAVAGAIVRNAYDAATRLYVLTYRIDPSIAAPTEVFVPATLHYPAGFNVTVTPASAATWSLAEPHLVHVDATASTEPDQLITVTVEPLV